MGASCPHRIFIPRVAKTPAARQRIARPLGPTFGRGRTISSRASLGCAQAAPPSHVPDVPRLARPVCADRGFLALELPQLMQPVLMP